MLKQLNLLFATNDFQTLVQRLLEECLAKRNIVKTSITYGQRTWAWIFPANRCFS